MQVSGTHLRLTELDFLDEAEESAFSKAAQVILR